jgi:hypothetical protein
VDLFEKWGAICHVAPDATAALQSIAKLGHAPALLVVDGGELEGPSPLDALATLKCPRLVLYPFGQAAPAAPGDGRAVPYVFAPRRPGDIDACYADPALARERLGWTAQYDLQRMCEDSWRWQSNNPRGFEA